MAITWRTLNQPTLAGVGVLMNGAQQGLNNGFQAMQNVLAQRNKTDSANWQVEKDNNTADYLNAVQEIKDPAQMADPATQANLAALRQQFGYKVDANAIRGADEKRTTDLQVKATNDIKFNDLNQEVDQRPLVDDFYRMKNAGDFKGAQALLDANGFINEGALADSLKSGQYAASNETRAVAQDARSAASNALNMQIGRESLAYNQELRKNAREDRSQLKAGDALLSHTISQFNEGREAAAQTTNQLAEGLGIKIVNGVPDLTGVPADVKDKLASSMEEKGLDLVESSTAARKRLEKDFRANGYSEEAIAGRMKTFESAIGTTNTLTAEDQKGLDAEKATVATAVTTGTEALKKDFANQTKNNIFLQGIEDPAMTVEDVTKSLKGNGFDPMLWEGWNREQAIQDTTSLMTKGVEIDGQHYDVPPAILKAGIAMGADDWFDPRQGIIDSVKAFIKSDPAGYAASIGALDTHKKDLRELNEAALKRTTRMETEAKSRNHIPADVTQLLKALKERK